MPLEDEMSVVNWQKAVPVAVVVCAFLAGCDTSRDEQQELSNTVPNIVTEDIQAGIEQLREDDATREEVREFIAGKLEEWGVELPELHDDAHRFQGRGRFMNGPSGCTWRRRFNDETS